MAEPEIVFEVVNGLGRVVFDRPQALNALTLGMVRAFDPQLQAWAADNAVRAVIVYGAGDKAFCAGGDIRALYDSGHTPGDTLTADFYREEYILDRRIKRYAKPYIAVIDGVTMGGGVGVSVHGSHRVATERTTFAMPETGIGLFPDVGGSYFLSRCAGQIGVYLALSGARLKAADCLHAGIATHYVPAAQLGEFEAALQHPGVARDPRGDVDSLLAEFSSDPGDPPLAARRAAIDRCFAGDTVEAIQATLETDGSDWAAETLGSMAGKSPISQKIALRQIRLGAAMTFEECMTMEYRLSQRAMAGHDFYEGVRAVVIDKDQSPQWQPATLAAVTEVDIDAWFAPLGEADLIFDAIP